MNHAMFMDVRTKPRKLGVKLPRSAGRLAAGVVLLCGVLLLNSTAAVAQVGSWTTGSVTTNGDTNNFVAVTTDSSGNFHGAWRPESGSAGFIAVGLRRRAASNHGKTSDPQAL